MITANIKKVAEILSDNLSLSQRGIMITILLCKDSDPKIQWAKIKAKMKMNVETRENLVYLHEKGFINYKGYKSAKKRLAQEKLTPEVIEIITFMNELYGRKFDYNSEATTEGLRNRLTEYSVEEIKQVISNRWERWKDSAAMKGNLRPSTIFRPSKFVKYLEDVRATKVGTATVELSNLGLEPGDEFTFEMSSKIIDKEIYEITTIRLSTTGSRLGIGIDEKMTGKTLKALLKQKENRKNLDGKVEVTYIYKK